MITIYTTPTCAYCHMAKAYFKSRGQEYKEVDISQDAKGAEWVYDHVGQLATPVIDIDGTVILGFDRPAIDAALK